MADAPVHKVASIPPEETSYLLPHLLGIRYINVTLGSEKVEIPLIRMEEMKSEQYKSFVVLPMNPIILETYQNGFQFFSNFSGKSITIRSQDEILVFTLQNGSLAGAFGRQIGDQLTL